MALSLERWLEIADSKKRLEKLSDKFKTVCVLIYIVIVWLGAFIFTLPVLLSFKDEVSFEGSSFESESSWNNNQVINLLYYYIYIFIYLIQFIF